MNIGASLWKLQPSLSRGRRIFYGLQILAGIVSLAGIGFFLWFYFQQNAGVAGVFNEMVSQTESDAPLTPLELAEMSHQACVLDTGITNVQSFLQPLSVTLSGGGWCGNYVRVFIRFADAAGYPAHKFHIQSNGRSHTLAEVYYQGEWRIIDPFFNQAYLLPEGEMATYQDLKNAPSLLETPLKGPVNNPRLDNIYGRYTPIFAALYRDAPDFYLAPTGSALYHNIFVGLSYPLALFYEGGRRPILPAWFDRPELLGVYGLSVALLVSVGPLGIGWVGSIRRNRRPGEHDDPGAEPLT